MITALIHLGYFAYDADTREAYVPNKEIQEDAGNILWVGIDYDKKTKEHVCEIESFSTFK